MKALKVAAVSYQNTIPFVYGLCHADINLRVELLLTPPFLCAENLSNKTADFALIPSVKLLEIENIHLFSPFCISASDNVYTVALFSNSEIKNIKKIYLDTDSRTSVELIKILSKEYWKISPVFEPIGSLDKIENDCGYLLIGDKVFEHENKFSIKEDLSKAWHSHTGLPFVFAVWAARDGVDESYEQELSKALAYGVENIENAIEEFGNNYFKDKLLVYLTQNIEFDLSKEKMDGLSLFLQKVKEPSSVY